MKKIFILFLAIFLFYPLASLAQSGQRMVLTFRSQGSMQTMGLYGPAGVTIKAEGYAYLIPGSQGKFTGAGEIVINAPAPMGTQKEPYEDNFDPHVLAPGVQPRAKIELKDGATRTFSFGPESYGGGIQTASWKTDFTLDGVELWQVAVEGEEIDTTQSPIYCML